MKFVLKMMAVSFLVLSFTMVLSPAYACAEEAKEVVMQQANINTDSAETLAKVNGIDAVTAKLIVDYRNAHGPFEAVENLTKVKGISSETLETIKANITVK